MQKVKSQIEFGTSHANLDIWTSRCVTDDDEDPNGTTRAAAPAGTGPTPTPISTSTGAADKMKANALVGVAGTDLAAL